MDVLIEHGFEGMAKPVELLLNEAKKLERAGLLGAEDWSTSSGFYHAVGRSCAFDRSPLQLLHLRGLLQPPLHDARQDAMSIRGSEPVQRAPLVGVPKRAYHFDGRTSGSTAR